MNTTTNTRVSEAEDGASVLQRLGDDAAKWAAEFRATALRLGYSDMDEGWLIGWFANAIEHSGDVRRWRKEAALSAPEPAAQGDGLCQRNPAPNAAPAVGMTSTQRIVYLSPEGNAPPAQPAERVPDPETACAMWIKPTTTEAESNAFLAGARAMLTAFPAPADGGKGVEGWEAACKAQRDAAIRAHGICYETILAHPDVEELGDDGRLHDAIHDIIRVEMPAAQQAAPDVNDVRARFEAVFSQPPYDLPMPRWGGSYRTGQYQDYNTQCAWEGYRAAHADLSEEVRELVEAAEEMVGVYVAKYAMESGTTHGPLEFQFRALEAALAKFHSTHQETGDE